MIVRSIARRNQGDDQREDDGRTHLQSSTPASPSRFRDRRLSLGISRKKVRPQSLTDFARASSSFVFEGNAEPMK